MARDVKREEEGLFGSLLAFFLGLIIGIAIPVASVVGAVYVVLNKPAKETVNMVDGSGDLYNTIFNVETGFLDPDYADKTIRVLLKDVTDATKALANGGSLQSLAKISPKIDGVVDTLVEKMSSYGLSLQKDELLAKPVGQLLPYLQENINNAPLGDLLQGYNNEEVTDTLLLTLCYGSPSHYTKTMNGTKAVYEMKQITYVYKDKDLTDEDTTKKMYDIDGTLVDGSFDESSKKFTLTDGTVYYLQKQDEGEADTYLAFQDAAFKTPEKYPYTTIGTLTTNPTAMIDSIYLRDAMGVKNVNTSHSVLVSLAYGTEGINYTVDPDGTIHEITTPRTIGELKSQNKDLINSITLGDSLGVNKDSHPILISLAYGVKDKDYTINEAGEIECSSPRTLGDLTNNSQDLIDGVHLTDVIKPDTESALTMYLLYGREGIHWKKGEGNKVVPLEQKIAIVGTFANISDIPNDAPVYNEWGEKIEGKTAADYSFAVLPEEAPIKSIKTSDGMATLYMLVDAEGKSVGTYEATTLGSFSDDKHLSNITKRMTLGEIVNNSTDNFLLKHVKDETIDSLPEAISNLAIIDVYEDMVYDTNNDGEYSNEEKTNKVPARTWWYLLHNEEECHKNHCSNGATCSDENCTAPRTCKKDNNNNCVEKYTVKDMNKLINNMTANMQGATLNQLNEDGMISLSAETLETAIIKEITVPGKQFTIEGAAGKTKLGELTVAEILTYNSNVLKTIQELQNYLTP